MGAGWFTSRDTYEREIVHPADTDEYRRRNKQETIPEAEQRKMTITLRPLNAGDRAELQEMQIVDDGAEGAEGKVSLSRQQMRAVQLALVAWTLPEALSPETIAQLEPLVFDAIYAEVSFGNPKAQAPKGTAEVLPLERADDEQQQRDVAASSS